MGHKERDENFLCYHTDMLTEENVKSMKDKCGGILKSITQSADTLEEIREATKITPDEDPRNRMEASQFDINSIHSNVSSALNKENTELAQKQADRDSYARKIGDDLGERELDFQSGSLVERQGRLRKRLRQEYIYLLVRCAVEHGSKQGTTLVNFVLINTVPCILHLENRVGLKLLRLVLEDGLANVVAKKIFQDKKGGEGGRVQAYLTAINQVVNHDMWGQRIVQPSGSVHMMMKRNKKLPSYAWTT